MKTLQAQIKAVDYIFVEGEQLTFVQKTIRSSPILFSDIAQAVWQEPSPDLEQSVLSGMRAPVILVPNTMEEWIMATEGLSNRLSYNPDKPYLCLIGNQRATIAKKNGFDAIDAFIVTKGIESVYVQKAYNKMEEFEDLLLEDLYLKSMEDINNILEGTDDSVDKVDKLSALITAARDWIADNSDDETATAILRGILDS